MKIEIDILPDNLLDNDFLDLLKKIELKGLKIKVLSEHSLSTEKTKPSLDQLRSISKMGCSDIDPNEWEKIVDDM